MAWKACATDDLHKILSYLALQLMAYPRAKSLTIDFVGWDHKVVHGSRRFERPVRFCGRLPEIIIRGLDGEQQNRVTDLISWFIMPNGRIGTTSSHFRLAEGGILMEVTPDSVAWKKLEQATPTS
jgi:hypothetical protein